MNLTFPVGGTLPKVVTVAVHVTFWPKMEGFRLETSVVAVANWLLVSTDCRSPGDVLAAKLASPLYNAVIVKMPAGSHEVAIEAAPEFSLAVPRTFELLKNVTVSPLGGVPPVELTVAVKVTACPWIEGFRLDTTAVEVEAIA